MGKKHWNEKKIPRLSKLCVYLLSLRDYVGRFTNHISTIRNPIFGRNQIPFFRKWVIQSFTWLGSNDNYRLLCRSIFLVKQHPFCNFFRSFEVEHFSITSAKLPLSESLITVQCEYIFEEAIKLVPGRIFSAKATNREILVNVSLVSLL